jgi:L-threonylcarbamoyladenylate synthase
MKTEIIRTDLKREDLDILLRVAGILGRGGVIVYPTDTFYGLGASGFHAEAVRRIYRVKQRIEGKPLSLVISDYGMLLEVAAELPPELPDLAEAFWPGPLTVVLPASPRLPDVLLGAARTIGVRVPDLAWLRKLMRTAGFPLTATSANLSGEGETADPREAVRVFQGKVDLIVDGGATRGGQPSTVLDLSVRPPRILRSGAVSPERLFPYLT